MDALVFADGKLDLHPFLYAFLFMWLYDVWLIRTYLEDELFKYSMAHFYTENDKLSGYIKKIDL